MENNSKKELYIFLAALVIVGATFGGGIAYLKGHGALLANVAGSVLPQRVATSPVETIAPASSNAAASSTTVIATSAVATTTKATKPTKIATTTQPVAPAPTITPTPAPTPAAPTPPPSNNETTTVVTAPPALLTLPYKQSDFSNDKNWRRTWGTVTMDPSGTMTVEANASSTGAGVFLANAASNWQDYTFTANLDWNAGESLDLMARYSNDANYVGCEFGEEFLGTLHINIQQHLNGQTVTLASADILDYNHVGGSNAVAYISLQGTQAICSFDNHVVSSAGTSNSLNPPYAGTVGFTVWDPTENTAQIVVKSVQVKDNH